MRLRKMLFSAVLVFAVCFAFNSDAGEQSYRYKKAKPFSGKFKGNIESNGVTYIIKYKVTMAGENLSGTIATISNGENVLPLLFTGTVKPNGKVGNIVLEMEGGISPHSQSLTPSDNIKISLWKKGKKGLKMIYTDESSGASIGDVIKYKRLK